MDIEEILSEIADDTEPEGAIRTAYLDGARAAPEAASEAADVDGPDLSSLEWSGYSHRFAEAVCPECDWPAPGARSGAGKHDPTCSLDAALRSPAERKARDEAVDADRDKRKADAAAHEEQSARRQLAELKERFGE
jgi:hypothetical protein